MPNIATAAKPAFTTVKTDFGQLCTDIVTDWGNTLNTSLQEGWGFSHFLKEVWGDIWQNFGQLISDMAAKWVMDFITPTVDETKKIGTAISESVSGPVSDIADSAGQAASGFLSALGSVGSIITAIASVISLLKGPQKQTDVTYWLKLQWELLQNSYNFFIGELTWKLDTIKNAVDGTIKQGITKISTATQKSRDYLQTIASKNYLKDVVGYLKDIATGIENLPGAASGAVFMMPTLARLAEREPEIIMPLREYQTERIMPRVENRRQAPIVVNIKPIVIDKKDHYLIKFIQDNLNHNALRVPTACVRG
jgi:hypothetical protein